MKQNYFRTLIASLSLFISICANAYDAYIDGIYYNFNGDEAIVTYYSLPNISEAYSGDVVIPSTVEFNGKTYNVTSIDEGAFFVCSSLTSVNIPSSVTRIGNWAFDQCSSLTSVNIPSSVTSIGKNAFSGCSSLSSVNIPSSVTSIGEYAFSGCSSLSSVNIPSSVTSIGNCAFSGCSSLSSVNIPSSVTSIGNWAFSGCSKLKDIEILGDLLTVNVTASENSSSLHKAIGEDNLAKVSGLKIIGSVNGYDIMVLRNKMPSLKYLDMSETTVVANDYKYYKSYTTVDDIFPAYAFSSSTTPLLKVVLPNFVKSIGECAFSGCPLISVTFGDGLQSIGFSAFSGCSLISVTFCDGLQSIGSSAFSGCLLNSVTFGNGLQSIGDYAFNECSVLTSVTFGDGLQSIGAYAFYNCSGLTSLTFGDGLQSIGSSAFSDCKSLSSVTFGKSVKSIGSSAFSGTQLTEVKIPSSVTYIGDGAFIASTLKDVYAYTVEPTAIAQNTFATDTYNGTLYVPKTSYYNYYYNTQWSQFLNIKEIDVEYDNFHVDGDYELDVSTSVVSGEPDIEINAGGGFIIDAGTGKTQKADEVTINVSASTSGSIITNNNISAKTFTANISVNSNLWYFITFPFDVDLKDVSCNGSYTFATYNGSTRAVNGKGGWQTVTSGKLEAGKGYIFQCNTTNTLTLSVKSPQFSDGNISTSLNTYSSSSVNNASWNFVGNPYPAYYGVKDLGFDAPITVWNKSKRTYEAYSVQDDDYVLSPFEAFFVQKPDATSAIRFSADKRMTYKQSQAQTSNVRMRGAGAESVARKIVNLIISRGEESDKTRLVMNMDASRDYEMERDAAKFISSDAEVQLYTLDDADVEYAINERPMETETVKLGYIAKADGAYTISAGRMDEDMELYDSETGMTFLLSNGDYNFTSKAGTFNSRFTIRRIDNATAISELAKVGTEVKTTANGISLSGEAASIYTVGGALVVANAMGDVTLEAGCYVVKSNGVSTKVVVK